MSTTSAAPPPKEADSSEVTAVRVVAYADLVPESTWKKALRRNFSGLSVHIPNDGVVAVGARWREDLDGEGNTVSFTSYLQVLHTHLPSVVACSGKGGVFLRQVAMHREATKDE
eukprot:15448816-Alexandrium_andersonii.AAC.1